MKLTAILCAIAVPAIAGDNAPGPTPTELLAPTVFEDPGFDAPIIWANGGWYDTRFSDAQKVAFFLGDGAGVGAEPTPPAAVPAPGGFALLGGVLLVSAASLWLWGKSA